MLSLYFFPTIVLDGIVLNRGSCCGLTRGGTTPVILPSFHRVPTLNVSLYSSFIPAPSYILFQDTLDYSQSNLNYVWQTFQVFRTDRSFVSNFSNIALSFIFTPSNLLISVIVDDIASYLRFQPLASSFSKNASFSWSFSWEWLRKSNTRELDRINRPSTCP